MLTVNGWSLTHAAFTDQLQQIADNNGCVAARIESTGEPFRVFRQDGHDEFEPGVRRRVPQTGRVTSSSRGRGSEAGPDGRRRRTASGRWTPSSPGLASGTGPPRTASPPDGSTPGAAAPDPSAPAGSMPATASDGTRRPRTAGPCSTAFGSYRDVLIEGVANLQVLQADLTSAVTSDEQLKVLCGRPLKDTSATQACVRHILVQAGSGQSDPRHGRPDPPAEEEYEAALGRRSPR